MKAAPEAQAALLTLVELDAKTKAAEHRKRTLPEHEKLNQLNGQRRELADESTKAAARVSDAETAMARLEADLATARARLARNQQRLDEGVVNDARSIASTQDEIAHLTGRIAELEDHQLEQMMAIDDDRNFIAQAAKKRTDIETQMRALIASRDESIAAADAEIAGWAGQRTQVAGALPADLAAVFEKVTARTGSGAAEFKAGRCTGCGLMLDALARRAAEDSPADEVIRCPECDRVLVRHQSPAAD